MKVAQAAALLALSAACESPTGPQPEEVIIERWLTEDLYDGGFIRVEDPRISAMSYKAVGILVRVPRQSFFVPIEQCCAPSPLSEHPELEELHPPLVFIQEGAVVIVDLDMLVLEMAHRLGARLEAEANLAVFLWGLPERREG